MGHSALEATGVIPGAHGAQMVAHTPVCPDNDAHVWGAATSSPGCPLQRYPHALPSGVVLDGGASAILARSHDHSSVWWPFPPGE